MVSGLKLNMIKSQLFGVGVDFYVVQDVVAHSSCFASKLPFIYLGLPIGFNLGRIQSLDIVAEKFKPRLAKWKVKFLSFGGRATLIKLVLGSISIYYMLLFKFPASVLKTLEPLRNNFLGGAMVETERLLG